MDEPRGSFQVVKEDARLEQENDSMMKSMNKTGRNSILSDGSRGSNDRNILMRDVNNYIDELNALINEDDWHNIPAPIKSTCDGIINL